MDTSKKKVSSDWEVKYKNWEKRLDAAWTRELSLYSISDILAADEKDVYLLEAERQLDIWERKIKRYRSNHKTDEFYDFQEFKTKLHLKLDSLNFSESRECREARCALFDRLSSLSLELKGKIHVEPSSGVVCQDCVHIKVVTLNI